MCNNSKTHTPHVGDSVCVRTFFPQGSANILPCPGTELFKAETSDVIPESTVATL